MDLADLTRDLEALRDDVLTSIEASEDVAALEALELDVLGKKGRLTAILRGIGGLPADDRPRIGAVANVVRGAIEAALAERGTQLRGSALTGRLAAEALDVTLPGRPIRRGSLHPSIEAMREIADIFAQFGFVVYESPEIEDDLTNFQMLNIPPDHPARDLWDTMYVDVEGHLLRTHTSPGQIRVMQQVAPPIRALLPGRCYRYEATDASHGSEFFQVEGLMVDEGTTMGDLRGLLEQFAAAMYGADKRTRFRPGYYPFTEPSVAFDVECLVCGGSGCPACGRLGWMTILGAGMVHPVVLQYGGIDPERYQGFAFGMGPERIKMLKHGITDLRLFLENDLRFLEQLPVRVPLSWLREYVDVDLSPEQLAERFTVLGMEVKGIIRWGDDWRNVVVGELLSVERHPRADRLSLTRVTLGDGEPLEIVCGATNIEAGQRVPVALPGAVLPGDRRIERTEKMGVVSNGMLCSGDELGLTADADGILILPADTPLGRPLVELFGDTVLDIDVKPNRGDLLSIVGIAREVAAVTGGALRFPPSDVVESGRPTTDRLSVEVVDRELCPRFVGRWVSGVHVGPSPDRIQMRLLAAGQRPISNVVDASNYVMVELGKPIHTFDAAAVHDGRIIVRRANPGERFETLDHVERELDGETLVIADRAGPIGMAGVMGGAASEIGEDTTEVVVESAIFDPISIRRTAFRYALRSDASLRFEKGQETRLARVGADRTARLIAEWAGGQVAPGVVDSDPSEPVPARVAFRPARVNRLLGTAFDAAEQRALLERAGIETEAAAPGTRIRVAAGTRPLDVEAGGEDVVEAIVPTWRRDLAIEGDVIEEIIRIRGYDTVPPTLPDTPMPPFRHDPLELRNAVRDTLVGAGLTEVVTYALVAPKLNERFPAHDDGALADEPEQRAAGRPVVVTNPLSSQHSVLRQSLVGSLLEVVSTNLRVGRDDVAIFEVGKGYGATGTPPTHEWWRLGIALTGAALPASWDLPPRAFDLRDAKGILELICRRLGFPVPAYAPIADDPNLHPGRAARVTAIGRLVGRVGELHPETIAALDLRAERIYVAEVAIAGLASGRPTDPRVTAPSRHLPAERDLAAIVTADRPAAEVEAAIRRHAGPLLRGLGLFDIYRGAPLAENEVSLAYRLILGDEGRTVTDDELDAAVAAVATGLTADVGARFRT